MKTRLTFFLGLLLCSTQLLIAQDLANCNTQVITLVEQNEWSAGAFSQNIVFENDCGCNTVGDCQIVSIEFPSNYTCFGLVIALENSLEWYDDHFDLYYIPDCTYDGLDNIQDFQKSNYIASVDPPQMGGSFDFLICAGEDLPVGQNAVSLDFNTSDLCDIEDCSNDNTPPTCSAPDVTINGSNGSTEVSIQFTEWATDNCGQVSTSQIIDLSTNDIITDGSAFPCGSQQSFEVGFIDENNNSIFCAFNVSIECPTINGSDEFLKVYGNADSNFPIKVKYANDHVFLITREQVGDIFQGVLYKIDNNGDIVWSFASDQNAYFIDVIIDGSDILLTGSTLPFENQNNSLIVKLTDSGSTYTINKADNIDNSLQRERMTGIVQINDGLNKYAALSHNGWISIDDAGITLLDAEGNINLQSNYDFSDDQLWSGPSLDIGQTLSIYGTEANDSDEGFIVNASYNLSDYSGYSFFGLAYIRDLIMTTDEQFRIIMSNARISIADEDFFVTNSYLLEGISLNRDIEGPISDGSGNEYYYCFSDMEMGDQIVPLISKFSVSGNDLVFHWFKYLNTEHQIDNGGSFKVLAHDHFLITTPVEDAERGYGQTDVWLGIIDASSCLFNDVDIALVPSEVNVVEQDVAYNNKVASSIVEANLAEAPAYTCYSLEPCEPIDSTCVFDCSEECSTETVSLSTGIDPISGDAIPVLGNDPGWLLIESPDPGIQVPKPAVLVEPNDVWDQLPGSSYISAYPDPNNNDNNISNGTAYVFERCFCVCDESSDVLFEIEALVDNNLKIDLLDENENVLSTLVDIVDQTTGAFTFPPATHNETYTLSNGVYCLRAYLKNDGSVTMGMSADISITGAGLIEHQCCKTYNAITGQVFNDTSCDGAYNNGQDSGLADYELNLCSPDGTILHTLFSDSFGYFTFSNVVPGEYIIKIINAGSLSLTTPEDYQAIVSDNQVIGSIDFGLCNPECISDNVAIHLDGVDDFIQLDDIGAYNDLSIGTWFKADVVNYSGAENRIMSFGGINRLEIGHLNNGTLWLFDQSQNQTFTMSENVLDGEWHHIAYVAKSENRYVYFDFEEVLNYVSPTSDINYGPHLQIGTWINGGADGSLYQGLLDEFKGFDLAIAENLLCEAFNNTPPNLMDNLRIYFDFEDGQADENNSTLTQIANQGDLIRGDLYHFGLIETAYSNFTCGTFNQDCSMPCDPDITPPICLANDIQYEMDQSGFVAITIDAINAGSFDDCSDVELNIEANGFSCFDIDQANTVTLVVTDAAGNESTCTSTVTILDPNNYCNDIIDPTCDFECSDECNTDNIALGTAFDPLTNMAIPIGQFDPAWILIDSPDPNIQTPRPAYVLNPNDVWDQLPGSNYISAYPNANNNDNNIANGTEYVFQRCFCVCEDQSNVEISVDAYVDNNLQIDLYDENNLLVEPIINITDQTQNAFVFPPASYQETLTLGTGIYCFNAALKNDGAVTMGMSIDIMISGAGLIENQCCKSFNSITGQVFNDTNCDGLNDFSTDLGIENFQIDLCESDGSFITSLVSDAFGYFSFNNIPGGNYQVKVINNSTLINTTADIYEVSINNNQVVGGIEFGFCEDPCANDDQAPECIELEVTIEIEANGQTGIPPDLFDGGALDDCTEVEVNFDQIIFDCNDLGPYNYSYTASDQAGNTTICEVVMEITDPNNYCDPCNMDTSPPTCIALSAILQMGVDGFINISVDEIDGGSFDNCTDVTSSISQTVLTCDNLGNNTILLTVSDLNGNSSTCESFISLSDPNDYCNPCNMDTTPPTCVPLSAVIQINPNGSASVEHSALDDGSTDDCSDVSIVEGTYIFNCDQLGINIVEYVIYDQSNNERVCETQVLVEDPSFYCNPCIPDTIPPICVNQSISLTMDNPDLIEIALSSIENQSYDECGSIEFSDDIYYFTCDDLGSSTALYTIFDEAGNTAQCEVSFILEDPANNCECFEDNIPPNCISQDIVIQLDESGNVTVTMEMLDNGSFDNCTEVAFSGLTYDYNCDQLGIYEVVLVVWDGNGNFSECPTTITVEDKLEVCPCLMDTIPPICLTQSLNINVGDAGTASVSTGEINNGSFDDCTEVSYDDIIIEYNCDQLGEQSVELTIYDEAGNSSVCSSTITVTDSMDYCLCINDIEPPICILGNVVVFMEPDSTVSIDFEDLDLGSYDECSDFDYAISQSVFGCDQVCTNFITVVLTDTFGNVVECETAVSVVDTLGICTISNTSNHVPSDNVLVKPNPSNGFFHVELSQANMQVIEVFDISGHLMLKKSELNRKSANLNLEHLATGTYILRIMSTEGHFVVKRIVKM